MKKNLLTLLCVALLSLGAVASAPVFADSKVGEYLGDDGTVYEAYEGKTHYVIFWTTKDGKTGSFHVPKDGNPDPDGDGKGIGKKDVAGMLKKAIADYEVKKNAESTPLGDRLNKQGKGFNPRGNPGDDISHDKGPSAPHNGADDYKKTAKQLEEEKRLMNMDARAKNRIGNSMGDGTEGGNETAPGPGNHGSGKKGGGDDSNSYKDHQNKNVGKTYDLGPRPDLINPNPEGPTSAKAKTTQKTPK
jgi:hypothetical protein